jgi:hypothetical protein
MAIPIHAERSEIFARALARQNDSRQAQVARFQFHKHGVSLSSARTTKRFPSPRVRISKEKSRHL